ncbi:MAG: thiolase family protein [Deltaproteobacteria bacterium]|nr:thiolase family protein [Deltaproteobacteria bacterium]MBM4316328.1 thiolase family protein [Deltaproteobacteria bacterium]
MKEVVILSAQRTAIGGFLGSLKDVTGPKLGAAAIQAAVKRSGVSPEEIEECLMGSVLTAGVGQAPARQAAIFSGLANSVRATTLNRVCGSGLRTVMWGSQIIQCSDAQVIVAGGMESMSKAPYLLDKAREGYRLGNGKLIDSMVHDGLWDVYNNLHMGDCAELCAKEKTISRAEQDQFALESYQRAQNAISQGKFTDEITGIEVVMGKEKKIFDKDEEPFKAKLDKLGDLKPAFQKEGTITAGNASSLSDGASALVLASADYAKNRGLKPIAKIIAQASHAQAPEWFTTAPVGSIEKLLQKAKMKLSEIDLFEINEAFSVVALACIKELRLDPNKVNLRGGAVALGHPIGASGARILTTLIHGLRAEGKRYGVASLCIGGGEASALLVEAFQ